MTGKRVDDVAGEMGAIGRRQRGALLALEVILQDQFAVVPGQDQVDAGSLEISVEQQLRVGDDNGASGGPMCRHRIDVDVRMVRRTRAIKRQFGVEFAGVIQRSTPKKGYYLHNIQQSPRAYHWKVHCETISCLCKSWAGRSDISAPRHLSRRDIRNEVFHGETTSIKLIFLIRTQEIQSSYMYIIT